MARDDDHLLELTAQIASAYLGNKALPNEDIPALLAAIYSGLEQAPELSRADGRTSQTPAVPIDQSVTDDVIICLEDGKPFKSLKRHLRTRYDLTPEAYREKWGLPADYPMVAPAYARQRSQLAKKMGLGKS